jgi:hypothetical protein
MNIQKGFFHCHNTGGGGNTFRKLSEKVPLNVGDMTYLFWVSTAEGSF